MNDIEVGLNVIEVVFQAWFAMIIYNGRKEGPITTYVCIEVVTVAFVVKYDHLITVLIWKTREARKLNHRRGQKENKDDGRPCPGQE